MNFLPFNSTNLKATVRVGLFLSLGWLGSCTTTSPRATANHATAETTLAAEDLPPPPMEEPAALKLSMTEWTLLEMRYDEAKAISAQHADVGTQFRVAADKVEVVKADAEGKPLKVKATGHVFVEMNIGERATALCEEAEITTEHAVFKGNPLLMQSSQVAKATSPSTSFRVTDRLTVSGDFDFIRPADVMQSILLAADPLVPAKSNAVALNAGSQ